MTTIAPNREAEPGAAPEDDPPKRRNPVMSFLTEVPGMILSALVLALLIKTFLIQAFFIPSGSMLPTLKIGDRVIVSRVPYYFHDPRHGDIVVFEDPNSEGKSRGVVGGFSHWLFQGLGVQHPDQEDFIKRVIGVPGDEVWGDGGNVYVNGVALTEPYLRGKTANFSKVRVPAGDLFVMGDNRPDSDDSRFGLGFVPINHVIGKAYVVIWPVSHMGWLG